MDCNEDDDMHLLSREKQQFVHSRQSSATIRQLTAYSAWFLHALVFTCYTAAFLLYGASGLGLERTNISLGLTYGPKIFEVNPALNESTAWFFTGPPTTQLDQNWRKLLNNANIHISEDEMHQLRRTEQGVRLGDGSGYLGQLSVYHSLHCVVSLTVMNEEIPN